MNDETLFHQAQGKSPAERAAFLHQACGSDAAQRQRIESLLAAHDNPGSFMARPLLEAPATLEMDGLGAAEIGMTRSAEAEPVGRMIGRYKLLQVIGEGGFGTVYMAEQQEPIRRRVAVKIIKLGMDTRQVIARFEAERQALAMMDHPNIARVLDAGATDTGRPYFVMELVNGIPITNYCDANRLTARERLELFVPVCQAVQHAHQKGIIHRDLKPSNVMVGIFEGEAVPKVIDFGVAKALHQRLTEKTLFTQFGAMVGTPVYMSPEQTGMEMQGIDTRSDIYTLGVLLYELLTGTTPLDAKSLREQAFATMMQTIREAQTPKPSTRLSHSGDSLASISALRGTEPRKLSRSLVGDLDWIVMKALEKDRSRRYETANGLGRDVERYLHDEPVEAIPPSAAYRFRKLMRRHRRFAALLLICTFFLLLFAVSSTIAAAVFSHQKEHQRKLADSNARLAQKNQLLADEREIQLADNYTVLGQSSGTWNGRAALWFANAALSSHSDPDRVKASLVRVKNWLRGQLTPVAAVGLKGSCDHITFNPANSRYLITFAQYGTLNAPAQIWDLSSEQPLQLPAGVDPVAHAAWTPEGNVVLGSVTGRVVLASIPDLKILQEWDAGGPVKRVAVGANGRVIAATSGKKLLAWNLSAKADPAVVEYPAEIVYVGFSTTGEYLATATESDSKARILSVALSGSDPPQLRQALGPVTHVFRGPGDYFTRPPMIVNEGRELLTISEAGAPGRPGTFKRYDIATGAELASIQDPRLAEIRDIAISPDGRTVAMANAVYSVGTNQTSRSLTNSLGQAFSPDGRFFANADAGVEVYKMNAGKASARAYPLVNRSGQPAFSHDGKYMAVLRDGMVQVLQIPASISNSAMDHRMDLQGRSTFGAFSNDGHYVAAIGNVAGTTVRTIQVCAAATGKPAGMALSLDANLVGADFSPDGQLLAAVTGTHGDPKLLRIWNWQTGALAWAALKLDAEPISVCFAPDGRAVAVHCMNGAAMLIDAATGNQLLRIRCRETRMVEGSYPWLAGRGTIGFSHDGRTLFTWGSRVIQAWDRQTGQERFAVRHNLDCWACAQSPDGRILATASYDGNLCLWDAANGHEIYPPIEHPNQVLSIAFSPDGRLVGTACLDWQTRVWEVSTGRLAYAMPPDGSLTDLRFTPDGRFVINASASGMQLWDAKTGFSVSQRLTTATGALPRLDISSDGHWALIAGAADFLSIVDLQMFSNVAKSPPDEALLWCELLSNARMTGSTIVNLSDAQWLERWRHYRRLHPEFRPI